MEEVGISVRAAAPDQLPVPGSSLALEGVPRGERHLPYLDGWRGFSILLVLVGHFTIFGQASNLGVELFFVLSGRLMAEILIVRRQPIPGFLRRRMSRILPALAFYVALTFIIFAPRIAPEELDLHVTSALGALFFFENYLPWDSAFVIYQHTWSLAVEEHSYLVLALLALLCTRNPRTAMLVSAALAAAAIARGFYLSGLAESSGAYARTDVRAASVLLSFSAYLWFRQMPSRIAAWNWAWVSPLCLAAGLIIGFSALPQGIILSVGTGLLVVAVTAIDRAAPPFLRLMQARPLVSAGLISFSLYLWQQPAYVMHKSDIPVLTCLVVAVGCALLSYFGIEKPARRYLNGLRLGRGAPEARRIIPQAVAALRSETQAQA